MYFIITKFMKTLEYFSQNDLKKVFSKRIKKGDFILKTKSPFIALS